MLYIERIGNRRNFWVQNPARTAASKSSFIKSLPPLRMSGHGNDRGRLPDNFGMSIDFQKILGGAGGGGDDGVVKISRRIEAVLAELVRLNCPIDAIAGVEDALIFAVQAFEGQRRHSGDPAFVHALDVLEILVFDLRLIEMHTLQAGILHDVKEDTPYFTKLTEQFGPQVVSYVNALTKMPKTHFVSTSARYERNRRNLFLSSISDYRIPIIKLADRLANMRTLEYFENPLDRQRIADETMKFFVPLADVLGIWTIKRQLEDLSFKYLLPEAYKLLRSHMDRSVRQRRTSAAHLEALMRSLFERNKLCPVTFTSKPRTAFSINEQIKDYRVSRKFKGKATNLLQDFTSQKPLLDFDTFNIVVDTVQDCYRIMNILQAAFSIPNEHIKDFIKEPKPNFYKSLNAEVEIPGYGDVRIKVRTRLMEDVADRGIAAWRLEQGNELPEFWIRLVESWKAGIEESKHISADLQRFLKPITVFSPTNEQFVIAFGSTVLDLAFMIHGEKVGLRAVSAVVNGERAALSSRLKDGQKVEIITSDGDIKTKRELWLRLINQVDGEARRRIRRFLEERPEEENIEYGRFVLDRVFKARKYNRFSDFYFDEDDRGLSSADLLKSLSDQMKHIHRDQVTNKARFLDTLVDLYWYVGTLNINAFDVLTAASDF